MTKELLNQLEKGVAHAIDTIEFLRLQVEELEEENAALKAEQEQWRNDLSKLLERFEPLNTAVPVFSELEEEVL